VKTLEAYANVAPGGAIAAPVAEAKTEGEAETAETKTDSTP
jgi:hypothetical protein